MNDQPPRSRPALILAVCLALPVIVLGYSWLATDRASDEGVYWEVPVGGYDPRDLLRGHYVQFQYEWPGLDLRQAYNPPSLCIEGTAPQITAVKELARPDSKDCERGRLVTGKARAAEGRTDFGKIYIPQRRGAEYRQQLSNPDIQATARVRIDDNGALHPVSLAFLPGRRIDATED